MYKEVLETKDLILKKATMDDLEGIYKNYWTDKESAKYMLWKTCNNIDEAREKLLRSIEFQKDKLAFFVHEKKTGEVIGSAGVMEIEEGVFDDVGIGFGTAFTKKGYGKQILYCFMDYIFEELNAKKFICSCFKQNEPSKKLQLAMGFKYFETTNKVRKFDGFEYLCDSHVITREEFINLKKQNYYKNLIK